MPAPKHGASAPTAHDASTPGDRIYKAVIHALSC
jgi:hypothetical protein